MSMRIVLGRACISKNVEFQWIMSAIADNLQAVQARISNAQRLSAASPPESVRLLAVSKTWPLACC